MRLLQDTGLREASPSTSRSLARRIVTMHEPILEAIELPTELAAERMREQRTHMAEGRRLPIAGLLL